MQTPIRHQGFVRRGLALSLALVIAFLGVAMFSSLHKHQGVKNRCSLNGFDQLMTGETEDAPAVLAALDAEWVKPDLAPSIPPASALLALFLRGPPAA